jgi:hypothetical protein
MAAAVSRVFDDWHLLITPVSKKPGWTCYRSSENVEI